MLFCWVVFRSDCRCATIMCPQRVARRRDMLATGVSTTLDTNGVFITPRPKPPCHNFAHHREVEAPIGVERTEVGPPQMTNCVWSYLLCEFKPAIGAVILKNFGDNMRHGVPAPVFSPVTVNTGLGTQQKVAHSGYSSLLNNLAKSRFRSKFQSILSSELSSAW